MSSTKKVFIIGPGFIGWSVLELLVAEGYTVTGLVRRESHAKQIQSSGATPVLGDLNDHALIAKHAEQNDITIHTATSDHLPSVEAALDGIRRRAAAGLQPIFIHTSGTSVLDDGSEGAFKNEKVYTDSDPSMIDSLPDDAPHRVIDLTIVRAAKELGDKAKLAIIIAPTIYGINPNQRRVSIQIMVITRFALKHGWVGHVGKGLAVESMIHVLDLTRAYSVLLHHMESSPPSVLLENPYFFCENGKEFSWKEVAEEVGKGLYAKGLIKEPTPREFSQDDYDDLFGKKDTPAIIGLNSRSRAVRLRGLGWEAKEKSMWESFNEDELPQLLKEEDIGKSCRYKHGAIA